MDNKIVAVIPALNEENTIESVLKKTKNYVDEIIVVDDCSKDKTPKIAEKYASVIKHSKNEGYDKSIDNGFKLAKERKADIIITLDADGQHLPEDIPRLIEPIKNKKADIVTGKRPYNARFMEQLFANFGKKIGIDDPLCGMKAYNIKVYDEIGFFDNITSIGTQLIFTALKKGYKIKNIKIKLNKRKDIPRFGRKLRANFKLLKALLKLKRYLREIK
jgi:glycosyltransferase involved in cell wall biosynthesis